MQESEVFNILNTFFKDIYTAESCFNLLQYDQYTSVLNYLSSQKRLDSHTSEVKLFLYYCCRKFDRFIAPMPYVIDSRDKLLFEAALRLQTQLREDINNTCLYLVHKTKWDLYDYLNTDYLKLKPKQITRDLAVFQKQLDKLHSPSSNKAAKVLNEELRFCESIIRSAKKNSLRTKISTHIPLSPSMSNLTIKTVWKNLPINVYFIPKFESPKNTFINAAPDNTVISMTPSQWQSSSCEVDIEFPKFIDPSLSATRLASHTAIDAPSSAWPSIFVDVYEILNEIFWQVRELRNINGRSFFYPSDLAYIKYELYQDDKLIDSQSIDSPFIHIVFSGDEGREIVEIDISTPIEWHRKCKRLADSFLQTGETNEATFWLNVGVESLLKRRSEEICKRNGLEFSKLSSAKAYFDRAEEVIASQFPDLVGKIKWDDSKPYETSWYTKIKYLGKNSDLGDKAKEAAKKYSVIHKYRNSLFHGSAEDGVSWDDAKNAFDAFAWIEANFK